MTSTSDLVSMDGKIAIVGMACRFPGGAHDLDSFWQLLKSGKCTMEEIPPSRFNIDDYWSKEGDEINKMMARKGHFLKEGKLFDEAFFNLSPREALNTDPQHRILLEAVVDGLDDAGYKPINKGGEGGWVKSRMGVFVGSAVDSYQNNLAGNIDSFFCPGMIRGFASGRISHYFGWQGPSIVYDTACSSALVAVHSACQCLRLNECDAAVATGTNMITSPEMFIGLSKGYFVSNTGGSRTFDETADGYCRAEGVGVIVLKRLADAVRDNDRIHAVILASGTNQSGPAESLTKPHAPTQAALFASNLARAGISPLAVRVVEAHGTGTQAGDYAEIEAIKQAYCRDRPPVASEAPDDVNSGTNLFVSSLKPNVGHSESAAGLASLIKAVLMMKHREMLPHIGISTRRNPRLGNLESHGIVIPRKGQPLRPMAGQEHIIISVNNFGAPGGNANVILQESYIISEETLKDPRTHHIVTISAKTHTPFSTIVQRLLDHLETTPEVNLASLSYTTTARRMDYPARLAFSVSSIDDLKRQLKKSPPAVARQGKSVPRIGFVLGGNGSQHQAMGKTLYETSSIFRGHIDSCDAALRKFGGPGILGVILGHVNPLAHDFESQLAAAASIFSVGYALGMLWKEWGVTPSLIVGHSMGEFAGLALAGCLSVENAMRIIISKIKSIHTEEVKDFNGGMLAVGMSAEAVRKMIDDSGCSGLEISCFNGPAQVCISGPQPELEKFQVLSKTLPEPPLVKLLPGFVAWHSSHLNSPAAELALTVETITFTAAEVPMMLNIDGSVLQPGEVPSKSYLADQMRMPVRFDLCALHPQAQDIDVWIELSAKAILLPLLRSFVPAGKAFLPSLGGQGTDSWSYITKVLGRLYEAHVSIIWAKYHSDYPVKLVRLPSYPFARNEHWVQYQDRLHLKPATVAAESVASGAELNREIVSTPLGSLEVLKSWRRYILHTRGHNLSPGAYLWLALTCTVSNRVVNLQVTHPEGAGAYLTIIVEGPCKNGWSVSFVRHDVEHSSEEGLLVASCRVESAEPFTQPETQRLLERSKARLRQNPASSCFSKAMTSKMLKASNDSFASMSGLVGQPLESLTVSDDGEEAVGMVHWPGLQTSFDQTHPSTSLVPFSPSQLRALLQPACLVFFLSPAVISATGPYSIDHFEFAKEVLEDKNLTSAQTLSVHVFLELGKGKSGRKTASTKIYINSQSGGPILRVFGFRKSLISSSVTSDNTSSFVAITDHGSPPSSPESLSSTSSLTPRTPSPTIPHPGKRVTVEHSIISIESPDHLVSPSPLPTSKVAFLAPTDRPPLTETSMASVLAQELGISPDSISPDDGLEDIGVDSIMSLLLRDKLSKLSGRRLKWFDWKTGMTVQDLWKYTIQAAQA